MPIDTGNFGRFTSRKELSTEQSYSDAELRNSNWSQYAKYYKFILVTDEKYPHLAGKCFSGEWDGLYAIGEQTDVIIIFSNSGHGYVYA